MTDPVACALLHGCNLPQAWSGQPAWRLLDTCFFQGLQFLRTWWAWKNDPSRPRMLHYVALASRPPSLDELLACATPFPELLALAHELAPQWFGLLQGFHRLSLERGHVLLTLCVGETTALLREQQFAADSVFLDVDRHAMGADSQWNIWAVKALARCCRRGTTLAVAPESFNLRSDLVQCGFELQASPTNPQPAAQAQQLIGIFSPRWSIKNTREPSLGPALVAGTCVVIGAGLAGASVAASLARRGWQVHVLDQGEGPAAGASGLPVGLVVPHVSADDCALSRLSRSGVRLMLQQARELLTNGQDWSATGTLERRVDGTQGLASNWPVAGADWSQVVTPREASQLAHQAKSDTPWYKDIAIGEPAIWHSQAAWLKPGQLVRAWLAQSGITFQGNIHISALRQNEGEWDVVDNAGAVVCHASRVVFANAGGALPLIEGLQAALPSLGLRTDLLPAMHGVRGLLSWALHTAQPNATFPPFPVNGSGSVVPAVPTENGPAWFVGSSYQPDEQPSLPDITNHAANLARLHKLLPKLGETLAPQFAAGAVKAWKHTRCVTADRLPAVGPLQESDNPSLWICAGMGSRGLSFSVLCAELLAARWGAEPLAIDAALARSLNALRSRPRSP